MTVDTIVKIGNPVTQEEKAAAERCDVKLVSFQDLEATGRESPCQLKVPRPDDIFTICYTSGSTGTPKGAIITHDNMISDLSAFHFVVQRDILGGRVRMVLSGSAPLSSKVAKFMRCVMGCHVRVVQPDYVNPGLTGS
ncbi:Long-chain-fatty-acid--CoA ligase 1 [Exaiptasia diaphana]|nr:Long-chain-fatty-acid--CoA ligase 1 [Exaiptasia diaphana]